MYYEVRHNLLLQLAILCLLAKNENFCTNLGGTFHLPWTRSSPPLGRCTPHSHSLRTPDIDISSRRAASFLLSFGRGLTNFVDSCKGSGGVISDENFRKNECIFHNFLVHFHFPVCVNYTCTGPILR